MGPQLDSCGRPAIAPPPLASVSLQWGRNLTVAEGSWTAAAARAAASLQWGRNLTVAEGAQSPATKARPLASMGPQLDSCGRFCNFVVLHGYALASMGPQLDSCGR